VRESPLHYSGPSSEETFEFDRRTPARAESKEENGETETQAGFYSSLEILGQILGCYLICASRRGLVMIDQHAAHERVAFERMRLQLDQGKLERQNLLIPQTFELPLHEAGLLERNLDRLNRLGFTVEGSGPETFTIESVPALLPAGDYRDVVRRIAVELAHVERSTELSRQLEERLMTIACHSVIRANRKLGKEEIQALLNDLDRIDFAMQCPHGRPVLIQISEEQLERMFKRV
jgi:DNA mismatch repair protein MutL